LFEKAYIFAKKSFMQTEQLTLNLESRKLTLIQRILDLADEGEISLLENILSPQPSESESLSPEVIKLIDQRLESFKANPQAGTSWEAVREKLLNRYQQK
jgi:hypothetical protein